MADSTPSSASFWTQANALLRKNLTYQKRNKKTNIRLVLFPFVLCVQLVLLQTLINSALNRAENRCGCICTKKEGWKCLEKACGVQYSDSTQAATCQIPHPPEWPPLLQVPAPEYRAVQTDFLPFPDLPNKSCRRTGSCPVTILYTGNNQFFGETLLGNALNSTLSVNASDILGSLARNIMGSDSDTGYNNFFESAFSPDSPLYYLQTQCTQNSTFSIPIQSSSISMQKGMGSYLQSQMRCEYRKPQDYAWLHTYAATSLYMIIAVKCETLMYARKAIYYY